MVAALEFLPSIPDYVYRYASFLFSFLGRGVCECFSHSQYSIESTDSLLVYIFVGSIMLHSPVIRYIAGSLVGLIGVGYGVLEFIPSIEPPANMREADPGWGAEQI